MVAKRNSSDNISTENQQNKREFKQN